MMLRIRRQNCRPKMLAELVLVQKVRTLAGNRKLTPRPFEGNFVLPRPGYLGFHPLARPFLDLNAPLSKILLPALTRRGCEFSRQQ